MDSLDLIKYKIENSLYKDGQTLKKNLMDLTEDNTAALYQEDIGDLKEFYRINKFLLDKVSSIHQQENSRINKDLLKENTSFRKASKSLEDGKRANRIYAFNDSSCDYYLIGDIHSDSISLMKILEKTNFWERVLKVDRFRLIFIGDYVDRGGAHLKTLQYILLLKYLFPNNIILQRGNHDGGYYEDGKVKMCVGRPDSTPDSHWFIVYLYNLTREKLLKEDIIESYINFFNSLAIMSSLKLNDRLFLVVHGGLPRHRESDEGYYSYIKNLADLTDERIVDHIGKTIVNNILWSDPSIMDEDMKVNNGRFKFKDYHFEAFKEKFDFDYFIRGHQVKENGYEKLFGNSFITIFSSGSIYENGVNINKETAYGKVSPKFIHINGAGDLDILDLN